MPEISALALAPLYERDTPVMSKTKTPKAGESAVNTDLNQIPVHLWRNNA